MDSTRSRRQSEVMQNILEALIRYEIVQEDEITGSAESIVSVECLWRLFLKVEARLVESASNQNKELLEVQKYVEHVRQLSEERDHLTAEFERENEKLKLELKNLKTKSDAELKEIGDMCKQEHLDELLGSSFSEQMAYLLVVRATLLDKLEVMEERYEAASQQCKDMDKQIMALTSEDSEMRQRMEGAMSEMGGMASKLTDALTERDCLKKEVLELSKALDAIQTLPSVNEAKTDLKIHQKDLKEMKALHAAQLLALRDELADLKQQKESVEVEYTIQVEELEEVNVKLREVNQKLNEQLSQSMDAVHEDSRKKIQTESQKIIEEMHQALEEDEAKSLAQQEEYKATILKLNEKISDLEQKQGEQRNAERSTSDALLLSAQLEEALNQLEKKNKLLINAESELHALKREFSAHEVATESKDQQFQTQVRISTQLQDRNVKLETELAKVVLQLKEALQKVKLLEQKLQEPHLNSFSSKPSDCINSSNEELSQLKQKVEGMESLLFRETSGTDQESDLAKIAAELAVCKAQIEKGKIAKNMLQSELVETKQKCNKILTSESVLRKSLNEFQQRALDAEAQILLITGQKNEEENQKLVSELNRNQLEDAVQMLRNRIDFHIIQLQSYINKYKNLKQKHRTKIRRIRELFLLERKTTTDEIERLEKRIVTAESSLQKELAWKEKASDNIKEAERDRRNAINEADRAAQTAEERNEQIKELNIKADGLVSEKCLLKKQLNLLEQQKDELEKMVNSLQQKERKEELTKLLSSLSLSGSLPYMGNVEFVAETSYPEEAEATSMDNKTKSDFVEKSGENTAQYQTSYLNLSPTKNRPVPTKRSVF